MNLDQGTSWPLALRSVQAEAVVNIPEEWPSHRSLSSLLLRFGRGSSQPIMTSETVEGRERAVIPAATEASRGMLEQYMFQSVKSL